MSSRGFDPSAAANWSSLGPRTAPPASWQPHTPWLPSVIEAVRAVKVVVTVAGRPDRLTEPS